jgi:hypothetical protein
MPRLLDVTKEESTMEIQMKCQCSVPGTIQYAHQKGTTALFSDFKKQQQ